MRNVRFMKHLILPALCLGAMAATTPASAQTAPAAFMSAIGDDTNVVFVENHVTINRSAKEVFDFVTTPNNIFKWFTADVNKKGGVKITGAVDHPNRVGDQVFETINFADGRQLKLVQTTVVSLPGFQWTTMGQVLGADGKPLPKVLSLAVWTVQPAPGGGSTFSRFFSLIDQNGVSRAKNPALDPVGSQAALQRLKTYLENPRNPR
jgi:uncharacterized protein YndB with AHSA1/START domain